MLSYRHSYHAGNFADVLKHTVLVEILKHLVQKDKPFEYIDTHAGAGLYNLRSGFSTKLSEFENGIGRLADNDWPELKDYRRIVADCNQTDLLDFYPGSPLIAMQYLRAKDRAWLFELHTGDFPLLEKHTANDQRVRVMQKDGYQGLMSLLPPAARRGLVLIDPSYEVKTEYDTVVKSLRSAWRKFPTGIYALWYPVVQRRQVDRLIRQLLAFEIKDIQRFELSVLPDSAARGMTGSGMIVINPPWRLFQLMQTMLPKLGRALAGDKSHFRCDVLVDES